MVGLPTPAPEAAPSSAPRREPISADGNGPMVTVTQGSTSHLPSSSEPPPPSSVPRSQLVVPTALKTKAQQDRAILLIKEWIQSDRQQSAAIDDMEQQLFFAEEERKHSAKQSEDAQSSNATVRDEALEEALW